MSAQNHIYQGSIEVRLWSLTLAILLSALPIPLAAQSQPSAEFDVNATIVSGCSFKNFGANGDMGDVRSLNFGSFPETATGTHIVQTSALQNFEMRCSPNTMVQVSVGNGQYASLASRRMRLGGSENYIPYRLCSNAACTILITVPYVISTLFSTMETQHRTLHYYGSVTLNGDRPPGVYTDEVTVTYIW